MTKINYQMPDEVWNVINEYAEREKGGDDYWFKFEGDYGNWNFLFAKMLEAYSDTLRPASKDTINKILESSPIVGMYNDAEKFIDDYNKWKDKMFKEYYNG